MFNRKTPQWFLIFITLLMSMGLLKAEMNDGDNLTDLSLSFEWGKYPKVPEVGRSHKFIAKVKNVGSSHALNSILRIDIPSDSTFKSASGGCKEASDKQSIVCDLGKVRIGSTRTRTIYLQLNKVDSFEIDASVETQTNDVNEENNEATAKVTISDDADMSVTLEKLKNSVNVGKSIGFKVRTKNNSATSARDVETTFELPENTEFILASEACQFKESWGEVICKWETIPKKSRRTTYVYIRPLDAGSMSAKVAVEADNNDPKSSNNKTVKSFTAVGDKVEPKNSIPTFIITPKNSMLELNEPFNFIVEASDADNDTLTYLLSNAPSWLSIEPTSGVINGIALEVGTYSDIMIKVSDGDLLAVSNAFELEVKEKIVIVDNNESDNDDDEVIDTDETDDNSDNNDSTDETVDNSIEDNDSTPTTTTLTNFIRNSGIEEGLNFWTSFGGGSALQLSTTEAHTGSQSIFVAGRTAFYQGPATDIKSLMVDGKMLDGERYMASVWVRHSESSAKTLNLMIKQVDSDGTHYNKVENEVVAPNIWTKITGFYLLNNSDSIAELMLYVTSSSDESVFDFYADDFYLSELEDYTPPTSSMASDFIRANGKSLAVGSTNRAIVLKGINVTVPSDSDDTAEDVWNVKSISTKDFNNIKALGFNSIRLHMNYISFEEDNAVGIYKKDGWHWLDRAISLAKDAGLYVMLDMHTPQGGYQSDKDEGFSAFWDGSGAVPNTSNQNRLIALWKAIASRYQHEPIILGYDFINEPRSNDSEEWFSYVEQIIAEVRTVDKNHMFVVEVPFIDNFTVRLVADNNVMYDSHYYEPWGYTTQYSVGYRKGGKRWGAYTPTNPIYLDWSFDIVDASHAEAVPFDKTFLQDGLDSDSNFLKFARDNNVPVDVGEYGIVHEAFSQSVGAMDFLRDFHAVLDKDSVYDAPISRFYFSYQGGTFGIYTNWTGFETSENEVNNDVKKLFSEDGNTTDNLTNDSTDENADKTFKVNSGGEVAYFSNHDLDTPNSKITHAIVVIHGTNRNALDYYETIEDVAKSEGKLESTIIIAPHFKEASDASFANELQWSDAGGWKSGSKSVRKDSLTRISSFAVLDEMVEELANNALFANLQEIIITGHSAGGQFTQRYAVTTEVDKDKDESFKYVVANAGTYLYINTLRPIAGIFTEPSSEQVDDCPKYNNYKYGLNKPYSYLSSLTEETLRNQYANRQVIYLLGENDTVADKYLNQGCEATLQGANRYERGMNYGAYMNHLNGLDTDGFITPHKHTVHKVIGVGHTKNGMYQSAVGVDVLF